MKKILAFTVTLTLLISMLLMPAYAIGEISINNIRIDANTESKQITIEGNISAGSGKNVTLQVIDPNGVLDRVGQTTSDSEGKFRFAFTAAEIIKGHYTAKIGAEGITIPLQQSFSFNELIPITPAAPKVTADDVNNKVIGMAAGMEYSLDGGPFIPYDEAAFKLINFSGNHILLVRISAAGINPAGEVTRLVFTENPSSGGNDGWYEEPLTEPKPVVPETIKVINDAAEGTNIKINLGNSKEVSKEVFEALKGTNKSVTFIKDNVQWTFSGKEIAGEAKVIDLTVKVDEIKNTTSANKAAMIELLRDSDVTIISFAENGKLPGKATVKIKLDEAWLKNKDKNNIYVYYYNPTSKEQERVTNKLKLDVEGYIEFDITHNSDYIVADKDLGVTIAKQRLAQVHITPVFSLYNKAYAEMLKIDISTKEGVLEQTKLLSELAPYWNKVATNYVLNGLKQLETLAKNKNLLDYNNMLIEFQDESKMYVEDKTFNKDYLLGELDAWGRSGALFSKTETDSIDQVNKTWLSRTKEDIDLSQKLIDKVQNIKSRQWLQDELNKIKKI